MAIINVKPKIAAPRDKLMAHMCEAMCKRLVYIHAPAGYGKTVSAHLWLERTRASYAWLALDSYDDDPITFCKRLVAALTRLQPDNAALREIYAHPHPSAELAVLAASAFENNGCESVLVFDDLHNIENEAILSMLPALVRRLDNAAVLFLSRKVPPDSLSEFVVKEQMALIDVADLKFSGDEIKAFFNRRGKNLTKKEADAILEATDGWAIGLNALLLSGTTTIRQKMAEEYFEAFIRLQIWDRWDEETRLFLLGISVVEELTGSLCEALTGRPDSEVLLRRLVHENAFIIDTGEAYHLHDLFRAFLDKQLTRDMPESKNELCRKAADWYAGQEDYLRAAFFYKKCNDLNGVTKSLILTHSYSTKSADLTEKIALIRKLNLAEIPSDILEMQPILLTYLAFTCYIDGKVSEMRYYNARIRHLLPKFVNQALASDVMIFTLSVDQTTNLAELFNGIMNQQSMKRTVAKITTLTENLPFYHRSGRDYSEFLYESEENLTLIRMAFERLMGDVVNIVVDCIQAGLLYEQGTLEEARRLALAANAKLREEDPAEIKFCTHMILSAVLRALGLTGDADKILDMTADMIQREKAIYLSANLSACQTHIKLYHGFETAAKEWLTDHMPDEHLSFYKIYQHFTTARAYIALGDYQAAILFIQKLLKLSEDYARPLDILEALVLLSIVLWKSGNWKDALEILEKAVVLAYSYNFTQIFTNEGADLVTMLHKLQNRFKHPAYAHGIPVAFVRRLYLQAQGRPQVNKGLTGGVEQAAIKFTKKQRALMKLMCEGHSYKEIAGLLGIGYTTVKSNVELIYRKLDVPSAVEAVTKIKALGILKE